MIKLKDIVFGGILSEKKLSPAEAKKAQKKFKETGEVPPHIKKLLKKIKDFEKKNPELSFEVEDVVVPGLEWMSKIKEGKLTEKVDKSKVDKSFNRVIAFVRKEAKKLNDDDLYAMTQKLAKWFK